MPYDNVNRIDRPDMMPDGAELLYKASFNRAWGGAEGSVRQQLENAHKNAISAVGRKFCKNETGAWTKV